MRKLELQIGYIADAIMQTKKKKFNEEFTTIEEVNIIKQVMQKRVQQKNLKVKFVDGFFERYFDIINGIITKADKETVSLRPYISPTEIGDTIYDEQFIYLCLCEISIFKLNNSIEHICSTCNTPWCVRSLDPEYSQFTCAGWSHNFIQDIVGNLSVEEQQLLEESHYTYVKGIDRYSKEHMERLSQAIKKDWEED